MKYLVEKLKKTYKERDFSISLIKPVRFLMNKIRSKVLNFILVKFKKNLMFKLRKFKTDNSEIVFDFAHDFCLHFIKPAQIKEEFVEFLKIFKKRNPKHILEIGTMNGGTLFCFCKLASDNAKIISIDLPCGEFGGGYPIWKKLFYQSFISKKQKLYLLRTNSHKQETLEKTKKILNNHKLDLIFIDGDHNYEGVKKDFEMYMPLVGKGGMVVFHDIVIHPFQCACEVNRFWKQIKNRFKHKEIIKNHNQKWAGIGILFI